MSRSKIFLYLCLSFVCGILISSFLFFSRIKYGTEILAGFFVFGLILISVFWLKNKFAAIIGFCILLLVLGIYRYQSINFSYQSPDSKDYYFNRSLIFQGAISADRDERIDSIKYQVGNIKIKTGNQWQSIEGKVLITAPLHYFYQYGDLLEIEGKLNKPKEYPDFNYKEYLEKQGIFWVSYFPKIGVIQKDYFCNQEFRKITCLKYLSYKNILKFKDRLRETISQILLPPQSALLSALILGDQKSLSDDLKEKLNITGTRHIVAISGMHITIIVGILMSFGLALGLWRGQAFWLAISGLIFYLIMIGLPASAIRGGIFGGLFLLAEKVGRQKSSSRAIVFAATAMLAFNPNLLKFDIGFQLSFLAIMGIIYFKPYFDWRFEKIPNPWKLRDVLSMTISATLTALPILIYNFGRVSLISFLSNILIVPLFPLIMSLGLIVLTVGVFWLGLAKILVLPLWFLLSYIYKVIDWSSVMPLAAINVSKIHWLWIVIYYLALYLIYQWKLKPKKLNL